MLEVSISFQKILRNACPGNGSSHVSMAVVSHARACLAEVTLSLQRRFSVSSWQQSSFILLAPSGTLRCNFLFINQEHHEVYLRCDLNCPHVLKGPAASLLCSSLNTAMHLFTPRVSSPWGACFLSAWACGGLCLGGRPQWVPSLHGGGVVKQSVRSCLAFWVMTLCLQSAKRDP